MTQIKEPSIPMLGFSLGTWRISISRSGFDNTELTQRYNKLASRWHQLTKGLGLPTAYRQFFEAFCATSKINTQAQPLTVLDCGCGTGTFTLAFAKTAQQAMNLHAVDLSPEMLKYAQYYFEKAGLEQAGIKTHYRCGDINRLPYPDQHFDMVMAAHVLEHMSDPTIALNEIHRVLKPGAWLALCATRESLLGRYIQLKWRTHRLNEEITPTLLAENGFTPYSLNQALSGSLRLSSLAYAAKKSQQKF